MAEETQAKAPEATPAAAEAVVAEAAVEEKAAVAEPAPTPEAAMEEKPAVSAEEAVAEVDSAIPQSASFKEESNVVADLEDPEKKALDELKQLVLAALAKNEFVPPPPPPPPPLVAVPEAPPAKTEEEAKAEEEPAKTEVAEPVAAAPSEEPAKVEEAEPPKPAEELVAPAKVEEAEPSKPEAVAEPAPPPVVEEKAVVVDEDGAKTVEAIEETVVPVPASAPPPPPAEEVSPAAEEVAPAAAEAPAPEPAEDVVIWGVPLLGDEKSDTVLLKFLRARDFKVKDTLAMIKNAVIWRKQFGIDGLLDEDLGVPPELEKVVFMHGFDKESHPVCYNVYGEFQDKELYGKAFGDEEKRQKFLKWRIQFLEKGIRQQLDFAPGAVCTMVQITDLKNVPGPGKRELRLATKQALALLQDNYPEFVAKQIFINVPWWYLAYNRMISSIFTQRSKSKFVFAGPSRSTETLFKYIAPEQVPVQYGGLSKEDPDFTTSDAVTEVTIKPSSKHTIEIPATEACLLVWELRVLGWEVSYGAEFVPSTEDGYTVVVTKARKFAVTDEPVIKNSFKISEPGKVVLTIDNATSKKKKLLYRSKVKGATESV